MWILGVRMVIQASTQQAALAFSDMSDKLKVLALKTRVFLWVAESPIFKETILINSKMARSISIHDWHSLWGKHRFLTGYDLHFSWWTVTLFSSNFPIILGFSQNFRIIFSNFPCFSHDFWAFPSLPSVTQKPPAPRPRASEAPGATYHDLGGDQVGILESENIMIMDILENYKIILYWIILIMDNG